MRLARLNRPIEETSIKAIRTRLKRRLMYTRELNVTRIAALTVKR